MSPKKPFHPLCRLESVAMMTTMYLMRLRYKRLWWLLWWSAKAFLWWIETLLFAEITVPQFSTVGFIDLVVRLGYCVVRIEYVLCRTVAAAVILGCNFCYGFVLAIWPRQRSSEMEDSSMVPIACPPLRHASENHEPLPSAQQPATAIFESNELRVAPPIWFPTESHTWVTVTSRHQGLRMMQTLSSLYEKYSFSTANCIIQFIRNKRLNALIANFETTPQRL